eukprot:CAMPEP_0182532908 /NCGR_PEP_ID=MMETSP1323-20130603/12580_1 /TAXON_ID=236787 /ORGANISM="Florenciella parvula, Strain RCC1693" /LENGTH=131 /DNA_ID=CAMNT_0024742717 /DNA_START=41 /DNA_END=436 /DNA_ORIENTATION=+
MKAFRDRPIGDPGADHSWLTIGNIFLNGLTLVITVVRVVWEVLYLFDSNDDDSGETASSNALYIVYFSYLYSVVFKAVKVFVLFKFKAAVDREAMELNGGSYTLAIDGTVPVITAVPIPPSPSPNEPPVMV